MRNSEDYYTKHSRRCSYVSDVEDTKPLREYLQCFSDRTQKLFNIGDLFIHLPKCLDIKSRLISCRDLITIYCVVSETHRYVYLRRCTHNLFSERYYFTEEDTHILRFSKKSMQSSSKVLSSGLINGVIPDNPLHHVFSFHRLNNLIKNGYINDLISYIAENNYDIITRKYREYNITGVDYFLPHLQHNNLGYLEFDYLPTK